MDSIDAEVSSATPAEMANLLTTTVPPEVPTSQEEEHMSSLVIFFVLTVLLLCIFLVHFLIRFKMNVLPESIAVIFLGAVVGLFMKILSNNDVLDMGEAETFNPTVFFLLFLPPIIFEAGYSLHKGNFFQNIGSILTLAIFGTAISALVIGTGIYILGVAGLVYELSMVESFAFGSLISAVDPVATLAIFQALDVDPVLYMLVFGESVLNDAVAIVMTTTVLLLIHPEYSSMSGASLMVFGLNHFLVMFFASAMIGGVFGLLSALLLKHFDLSDTPSLEFGFILIFAYLPYGLAEGIHLSGIMAALFCGITMSHYTHFNLSPMTQITVQQAFRTMSFMAENCVFAYLGLAIFSFHHRMEVSLIIWSLLLILMSRALNIFPLSFILNFFRDHKITRKMQTIMWFSGLRGAIAFALSLFLNIEKEKHDVIKTTTLIIVLFSTLILGGCTMPLMKLVGDVNEQSPPGSTRRIGKRSALQRRSDRRKHRKDLNLVKTHDWKAIDSEAFSELTESEDAVAPGEVGFIYMNRKKGLIKLDEMYLKPFFTKRFTNEEIRTGRIKMKQLTNQWYSNIRRPHDGDSSAEDDITLLAKDTNNSNCNGDQSDVNNATINVGVSPERSVRSSNHFTGLRANDLQDSPIEGPSGRI